MESYGEQVDHVYLFCIKPLKMSAKGYERSEEIMASAGITMELVTDNVILDLVSNYSYLESYYFGS